MKKLNVPEIVASLKKLVAIVLRKIAKNLSDVNPEIVKLSVGLAIAIPTVFWVFTSITGDDGSEQALLLTAGQTYVLENANRGPLLLTAAPTLYASTAFLGPENEGAGCLVSPNTRATLIEQVLDNHVAYARLKLIEGRCKGRVGWTAMVNVREQLPYQ